MRRCSSSTLPIAGVGIVNACLLPTLFVEDLMVVGIVILRALAYHLFQRTKHHLFVGAAGVDVEGQRKIVGIHEDAHLHDESAVVPLRCPERTEGILIQAPLRPGCFVS